MTKDLRMILRTIPHSYARTPTMPPKKKAKTNGRTLNDFLDVLTELSNLYEKRGDERRADSFRTARENLQKCDETAVLETSKDYKNIKGVGKSTLELLDEFLESGKCARLDELRGAEEQVALIRDVLELGVFKDDDGDKNYLFLYEVRDFRYKRALYKDADRYFAELIDERQEQERKLMTLRSSFKRRNLTKYDTPIECIREETVEPFADLERLSTAIADEYDDNWDNDHPGDNWDKVVHHHFVRKANANDLKRKDWKGDADVNWKKPNAITRDELRDLLRAGNYEKRYEKAFTQLIEEEKSFLEKAKTDLLMALCRDFPYLGKKSTFDGGFNLLVEDTFLDFYGYKMYCKQCEEPYQDKFKYRHADVFYELHLCGKKCYLGLGTYGECGWSDEDCAFHFTDFFDIEKEKLKNLAGIKPEKLSWHQTFSKEKRDWSFCHSVAKCVGKELEEFELPDAISEEYEFHLSNAINELYDKHNLRRDG